MKEVFINDYNRRDEKRDGRVKKEYSAGQVTEKITGH